MSTSSHRPTAAFAPTLLAALAWLGACSRQSDLDEKFEPPRRIQPRAVEPAAMAEYEVLPADIEFSFGPARKRVEGRLPLAQGRLQLSADDLLSARGTLRFDLARLQVTDDDEWASAGGPLTPRALGWLQITGTALGDLAPLRFARVSAQRLGGAETERASEGRPVGGLASGSARRVRLQVTFELELHGIISPYTAPLELTFHWSGSEPAGAPERIDLATLEPVRLDLLAHRIWPRDEQGEVLAEALAALRARPLPELLARAELRARRLPVTDPAAPP